MNKSMFIKEPNIPNKKIKSVLIDYRAEKTKATLEAFGIKVYVTPNVNIAYDAVSGHPDMSFHHLDENTAVVAPETFAYYCGIFGKEHIIKGSKAVGNAYPDDVAYNSARLGMVAFHNAKLTDSVICENYKRMSVRTINIKQGYSKCSICIVSKNEIITEDRAIALAAEQNDIDCLLLKTKSVSLKGFPHGFIGGATGLISENELFFNGDITKHEEYGRIFEFCKKHNVDVVSADYELEDIGSIIPLEI